MSVTTISTAQLPADVRAAGPTAIKNYKTALGFEQMLVGQMVKEMVGKDGPLADSPYASNMQDTLTQALVGGRGIGIAKQVYKEMQQS
jgi:Rod binding domain-containing protein